MALFRKTKTPYSIEDSDITGSKAEKVAERMVRVFRAAGLEAYASRSRKSASRYVYVENPGQDDEVRIRISDHYLPDRHADLEMGIDYQVFTSDMEALAETVRAVLQRFGVPEPPKELQEMLRRSAAQKGKPKKRWTKDEILRDKVLEMISEWEPIAGRAYFSEFETGSGDVIWRLMVPSEKEPLLAYRDGKFWKSRISHGYGRSKVSAEVGLAAEDPERRTAAEIAAELIRLWKENMEGR